MNLNKKNKFLKAIKISTILILIFLFILIVISIQKTKYHQVKLYVEKGIYYLEKENYEKAYEQLNQALKLDPDNIEANFSLATIFLKLEDYEKSRNYFTSVLNSNPETFIENETYVSLSNLYLNTGDYENAIYYSNKILEKKQSSLSDEISFKTEAYKTIGISNLHLGKTDEALQYFNRIIALESENMLKEDLIAEAYLGIGYAYLASGDCNKSIENLNKALDLIKIDDLIKTKELQIYHGLGRCYFNLGNPQKAKDYFLEILKIKNDIKYMPELKYYTFAEAYAYLGLGDFFLFCKEYNSALENYNIALNILSSMENESFVQQSNINFMSLISEYRIAEVYFKKGDLNKTKIEINKIYGLIESFSEREYSLFEKMKWFEDGKNAFQKIYSLENELTTN